MGSKKRGSSPDVLITQLSRVWDCVRVYRPFPFVSYFPPMLARVGAGYHPVLLVRVAIRFGILGRRRVSVNWTSWSLQLRRSRIPLA